MQKSYLRKKLLEAEASQRGVVFHRICGNCGGPARFEYEPPGGYYFIHRTAYCLSNESFSDRESFLKALTANAGAIYKVKIL